MLIYLFNIGLSIIHKVLYNAIKVCPTNNSDVISFQYVIDTCVRKIFNAISKEIVHECEIEFGVFPVIDIIDRRKSKFLLSYNLLCQSYNNCTELFDCQSS